MSQIQLEQRIDLQRISPTTWRLIGLVGQAIFFYAEAGSEEPEFTIGNQLAAGDVGQWRAIDGRRRLIVGQGGMATVAPKPEGGKGEVQISFTGISLAL
jgi:hypothetical protein